MRHPLAREIPRFFATCASETPGGWSPTILQANSIGPTLPGRRLPGLLPQRPGRYDVSFPTAGTRPHD